MTFSHDQPMGFIMQYANYEGKVILSKFWHTFHATNENLCQPNDGAFIKAGENWHVIVRLFVIFRCVLKSGLLFNGKPASMHWSTIPDMTRTSANVCMSYTGWRTSATRFL